MHVQMQAQSILGNNEANLLTAWLYFYMSSEDDRVRVFFFPLSTGRCQMRESFKTMKGFEMSSSCYISSDTQSAARGFDLGSRGQHKQDTLVTKITV